MYLNRRWSKFLIYTCMRWHSFMRMNKKYPGWIINVLLSTNKQLRVKDIFITFTIAFISIATQRLQFEHIHISIYTVYIVSYILVFVIIYTFLPFLRYKYQIVYELYVRLFNCQQQIEKGLVVSKRNIS